MAGSPKGSDSGASRISVQEGELDQAIDFAVSLGACVASVVERDEGIVVLLDPEGHPFCFLTAAVPEAPVSDSEVR
ncbi:MULTISPECIES: VOC family protein [Rhodococcus]|uniref:VOC family protein n=1 Tax=Rhodococcus TaxID=1827 RepID=UPI0007183092|nr:hypothetical protein [Rhodococcus sp. MH15]